MKKWEYMVKDDIPRFRGSGDHTDIFGWLTHLNEIGGDGWELVVINKSGLFDENIGACLFKREIE